MKELSVSELQLLSFFEVEPTRLDEGVPWPFNDFTYNVEIGEFAVRFGIAPAYKDLSFSIMISGVEFYSFVGLDVKDVTHHDLETHELLVIEISNRSEIILQIRPHVKIVQKLASER